MNADFAEIIKRIIADQGGDKEAKRALTKAVKMRFAEELKNASEKERPFTKSYLAQKLHEEGQFDLILCNKTLDTLCAALFNDQSPSWPPESAPRQQAAQEPAAEPTNQKVPRRTTSKRTYILTIIVLTLLFVIAVGVWYKVWTSRTKPGAPFAQENTTEPKVSIDLNTSPAKKNITGYDDYVVMCGDNTPMAEDVDWKYDFDYDGELSDDEKAYKSYIENLKENDNALSYYQDANVNNILDWKEEKK
jgi:hypothetical protein